MQQDDRLVGDIRALLAKELMVIVDSPEVDLLDTGLVDSVGLVELVVALEVRFGIAVPMEDLQIDDFRSVRRVAQLVERLSVPSLDAAAQG